MKMENTSMEFVTFDAQDVITTSGGPTGISFKVTGSLFDLDTGWQHSYDSYWVSPNHGFGDFAITDKGYSLTEGQYYTIAEGAEYEYTFNNNDSPDGSYTGWLRFKSGLTAGNTGAEEKTSLKEILSWLGVQNIIQ